MQLNTYVQLHLHGMVLNEAENNPNPYISNNLFRGETTINEIVSPLPSGCVGNDKIQLFGFEGSLCEGNSLLLEPSNYLTLSPTHVGGFSRGRCYKEHCPL
jgi:hypothetical protein